MLKLFGKKYRRVIDHGRVPCPMRKSDTEIDVCAACPQLIELNERAESPFVLCALDGADTALRDLMNSRLPSITF